MKYKKTNLTDEDIKELKLIETVTNLVVFTLPVLGAGYVARNFLDGYNLVTGTLTFITATFANNVSKKIEKNYNSVTNFRSFVRRIRKKLAPKLLALNIFTVAISGWNITKESFQTATLKKTGALQICKIINNYQPNPKDIIDMIENGIVENILLSEEEKEEVRKLYPFLDENLDLRFSYAYHQLNTIDVFYVESEEAQKEGIIGDYNRETNEINVYNGSSIKSVLPHEFMHAIGHMPIRFLNEGMDSNIIAEYCNNDGFIENDYDMEIYLTSIIIDLVGKETMLEAYLQDDFSFVLLKLKENSDTTTVLTLLTNMEKLCQINRNYKEGNATLEEYEDIYTKTKQQLRVYLDQKLPCTNPKTLIQELSKRARICENFETVNNELQIFIPRFYYNRTEEHQRENMRKTQTLEEALETIENFNNTTENTRSNKY